jgi:NAD(P)-dependent dehydrogenase (short-subunit alcohol dehydrogenase family)
VDRTLTDRKVVIIGGVAGMGLAAAELAVEAGAHVVVTGKSAKHLQDARSRLGPDASIFEMDVSQPAAVAAAFRRIGSLDHLALPGGRPPMGTFSQMSVAEARAGFDTRFWGQWMAVREALPAISGEGSIVLVAGAASQRPGVGEVGLAAVNAAVEGLGRGLAVELAPIRVNVFSPGNVATGLWEEIPDEVRQQEERGSLLGRMATPEEAGSAILFLLTNEFLTGTVLHLDGGRMLVS